VALPPGLPTATRAASGEPPTTASVPQPHGLALFRGENVSHGRRPLHVQIRELLFKRCHLFREARDLRVVACVGEQLTVQRLPGERQFVLERRGLVACRTLQPGDSHPLIVGQLECRQPAAGAAPSPWPSLSRAPALARHLPASPGPLSALLSGPKLPARSETTAGSKSPTRAQLTWRRRRLALDHGWVARLALFRRFLSRDKRDGERDRRNRRSDAEESVCHGRYPL
jgi:hypothetical protein